MGDSPPPGIVLPERRLGRKDIEALDRTRLIEAQRQKFQLWDRLVSGLAFALRVASFSLPLLAARWLAEAMAGKATLVSVDVSVGLTAAGFGGIVTWLGLRSKLKEQSKELVRCRERCTRIEEERDALRKEVGAARGGKGERP